MHVTKRDLGESYIAGTGVVLGLVLCAQLLVEGIGGLLWGIVGLFPVVALVASVYWVDRLEFEGDQVWTVAVYSAVALGTVAVALAVMDAAVEAIVVARSDTFLLVTTLGTVTATGALVGVVRELRRSNRRLGLRNAVLHRILRHNLRNDMTVVLCHLDELEASVDGEDRERIEAVRRKVEDLVDLTDTARKVNVTVSDGGPPTEPVDLAALVDRRLDRLTDEYPSVDVSTDLPDCAPVRTNGAFGLVLDNLVRSAATRGGTADLHVELSTSARTVALDVEDRSGALPDADLAAVTNGTETALEHGLGMELWFVYWLVDANDGHIDVETDDGVRCIHISLDPASGERIRDFLPGTR